MFPISNRKIVGYHFGDKTFYNDFHIGVDYAKENDQILAPFDGNVTTGYGPEGGNTLYFKAKDRKELIRFLHLKEFKKKGDVREGELIGIVGYTGLVSPPGPAGAHCHLDISINGTLQLNNKNNFTDPEKYDWEKGNMNQTKIVKSKDGKTLYECKPIAITFEQFKKQASVEGIIIPDPIPPASSL